MLDGGETADKTNACVHQVMQNCVVEGETLIFDHLARRDWVDGIKKYRAVHKSMLLRVPGCAAQLYACKSRSLLGPSRSIKDEGDFEIEPSTISTMGQIRKCYIVPLVGWRLIS